MHYATHHCRFLKLGRPTKPYVFEGVVLGLVQPLVLPYRKWLWYFNVFYNILWLMMFDDNRNCMNCDLLWYILFYGNLYTPFPGWFAGSPPWGTNRCPFWLSPVQLLPRDSYTSVNPCSCGSLFDARVPLQECRFYYQECSRVFAKSVTRKTALNTFYQQCLMSCHHEEWNCRAKSPAMRCYQIVSKKQNCSFWLGHRLKNI